jgi:hypothetical protein
MAAGVHSAGGTGLGATQRRDAWWVGPAVTAAALGSFVVYATFRALYNAEYQLGHGTGTLPEHAYLLSPFYSPLIIIPGLPAWLSPAMLILWAPGGFRVTCYYYRKAYYRAFFADPMACAVGEPRKGYLGEAKFPFILQNLHRYFLYLAIIFIFILWTDVVRAFIFDGHFGVGLGSIIETVCIALLTLYTFSCHSLRHLVGGGLDCFSCAVAGGPRRQAWGAVSILNEHHMAWAWWSLFFVCFADFYIRMCSMGVLHDVRLL